jgi:hypothetical protein
MRRGVFIIAAASGSILGAARPSADAPAIASDTIGRSVRRNTTCSAP